MVIKMKVVIGTDHNGTNIKKEIIRFLNNRNIEVVDVSEHNSAIDDYPLYAFAAAKKVLDNTLPVPDETVHGFQRDGRSA